MNTTTTNTTDLALTGVVQAGVINYNVDTIKAQARQIKDMYEHMTYSSASAEEANKEMKADRAKLNKAATQVKSKLSEVKAAYMATYTDFESGVKEAIETINEAKDMLDKKVKEFEEAARAEKKAQITDYYDKSFTASGIDPNVKNVIFTIIYDPKWENATTSQKAYKDGIESGLSKYESGIKTLSSDSFKNYKDEAVKVFMQNLDINAALAEVEALKKRDEEVIRREKERLEAEAKKKAEAEILEARRRAEEAERAAREAKMQAELSMKADTPVTVAPTPVTVPSPAPTTQKAKVAIQVVGGAIVGVYSDIELDVTILDEDIANDQRELAEFAKLTANMKQLY